MQATCSRSITHPLLGARAPAQRLALTRIISCSTSRLSRLPVASAASFPAQPADGDAAGRPLLSPDGIIAPDGTVLKQAPRDPEHQRRLWKAAIKAPMYSVGLAPILVSAAAAYVYTGAFAPLRTLGFCVASIAIIAWLNLSNDVFDSQTGVDVNKAESVVNLTGSRRRVFAVATAALLAGAGLLFHLLAATVRERVGTQEREGGERHYARC